MGRKTAFFPIDLASNAISLEGLGSVEVSATCSTSFASLPWGRMARGCVFFLDGRHSLRFDCVRCLLPPRLSWEVSDPLWMPF